MSTLFKATCLHRDTATGEVGIQFKSIHPDSGEPAAQPYFAMQILADFLRNLMSPPFTWGQPPPDKSKIPTAENAPALNDEIVATDCLDESWLYKNTSSYVKNVSYNKANSVLIITPTHPAWTQQCTPDQSLETAAYLLSDRVPANVVPAAPLTPVDRSVPVEVEEDPFAGFEMKKPKKFREDTLRRQRAEVANFSGGFGGSSNNAPATAPDAFSGGSGWAKPKAQEAKADAWGSNFTNDNNNNNTFGGDFGFGAAPTAENSNNTTATTTGNTTNFSFGAASWGNSNKNDDDNNSSGFGSGGGFGDGGFGGGFGSFAQDANAKPQPSYVTDPMSAIPDREIPLPKFPAVKYRAVLPLPDKNNLELLPVLYTHFGGMVDLGTVIKVYEVEAEDNDGKAETRCIVYCEGDIMTSCGTMSIEKIHGRAALIKERKRV